MDHTISQIQIHLQGGSVAAVGAVAPGCALFMPHPSMHPYIPSAHPPAHHFTQPKADRTRHVAMFCFDFVLLTHIHMRGKCNFFVFICNAKATKWKSQKKKRETWKQKIKQNPKRNVKVFYVAPARMQHTFFSYFILPPFMGVDYWHWYWYIVRVGIKISSKENCSWKKCRASSALKPRQKGSATTRATIIEPA